MGYDWKYGRVTTERGDIGEDEPVFVIRARDRAAVDAIETGYINAADAHGARDELLDVVRERVQEIRDWQAANKTKVPDTVPGQIIRPGEHA